MTETNAATRRRQMAMIHLARAALGMPEDSYRALLESETGKRSAADLDDAERRIVLNRFRRLGWRPAHHPHARQRAKIAAMLRAAGKPPAYADGIARRMHGRPLGRCDAAELRGVIAALEVARRREAAAA